MAENGPSSALRCTAAGRCAGGATARIARAPTVNGGGVELIVSEEYDSIPQTLPRMAAVWPHSWMDFAHVEEQKCFWVYAG
jgi:hypothetical protein